MTLYKRDNTYWVRYKLKGKLVRKSLHTTTRQVALALLNTLRAARSGLHSRNTIDALLDEIYGTKTDPKEKGLLLENAWSVYLNTIQATGLNKVANRTLEKRELRMIALIKWLNTDIPIITEVHQVTGAIATRYATYLVEKGLHDKTRLHIIADLTQVWNILEKTSSNISNPWRSLRPRVTDSIIREPFTVEEENKILEETKRVGYDWHLACLLARHTGLRYGDVATLKWDEVDLDQAIITRTPNKTKRQKIVIKLPIETHILLPALQEAFRARQKDNDFYNYVLPSHAFYYALKGHSKFPLQFSTVLKAVGIDTVTHSFHSWRHTINTRMSAAGIDMETRKEISGHTTDEMSRRYDHDAHLSQKRKAIEAAASSSLANRPPNNA